MDHTEVLISRISYCRTFSEFRPLYWKIQRQIGTEVTNDNSVIPVFSSFTHDTLFKKDKKVSSVVPTPGVSTRFVYISFINEYFFTNITGVEYTNNLIQNSTS